MRLLYMYNHAPVANRIFHFRFLGQQASINVKVKLHEHILKTLNINICNPVLRRQIFR